MKLDDPIAGWLLAAVPHVVKLARAVPDNASGAEGLAVGLDLTFDDDDRNVMFVGVGIVAASRAERADVRV